MPSTVERTHTPAWGAPVTYRAFVPDPVASLDVRLSSRTMANLETAAMAARDIQSLATRPGLVDLPSLLLLAEAAASSRIEHIEASAERTGHALLVRSVARDDTPAFRIAANVRAATHAWILGDREARPSTERALELHDLLHLHRLERSFAGRLRERASWVGVPGSTPATAIFVPPPAELIGALMADLDAFCARDDLSVLAQAAIAHGQFETIHPFADGNGRTGRALVTMGLRFGGVTPAVPVPVSISLGQDRTGYYAGLTAFREGDLDAWCSRFADAVADAAGRARRLAQAVTECQASWRGVVRPRRGSAADTLLERLPASPVLDVRTAAGLAGVSDPAANGAMAQLAEAGVIEPITDARRGRVFAVTDLVALLDRIERPRLS